MQLEYLCDMELAYRAIPPFEANFILVRPYGTEEGTGYGEGDGTVNGPRLKGVMRWVNHPHRRSDGTMLPNTYGLIKAEDGANIMFHFEGRTSFSTGQGKQLLLVIFEAEDERYAWLNSTLCVLEGIIDAGAGVMRARVFSCINDLSE